MKTTENTMTAKRELKDTPETKTKKSILTRLKEVLIEKKPDVKKLGMLTAVEVMTLARAEEGLALYPFHLYRGKIKGTVECKHKVPKMKTLVSISLKRNSRDLTPAGHQTYKNIIDEIFKRGYILPIETHKLKNAGFSLMIEEEPALFIIAPVTDRSESKSYIPAPVPKDPIIFIKYGQNAYLPLHSWDHSEMLDTKLSKLN